MKQVYLILAALMLLCLAPMSYGYGDVRKDGRGQATDIKLEEI